MPSVASAMMVPVTGMARSVCLAVGSPQIVSSGWFEPEPRPAAAGTASRAIVERMAPTILSATTAAPKPRPAPAPSPRPRRKGRGRSWATAVLGGAAGTVGGGQAPFTAADFTAADSSAGEAAGAGSFCCGSGRSSGSEEGEVIH